MVHAGTDPARNGAAAHQARGDDLREEPGPDREG